MEYLAYSLMDSAYAEATVEEEYNLPEFQLILGWRKSFKSAWLTYALYGALFAISSQAQTASAAYTGPGSYYVNTNGSCLNLRTGPSRNYRRVACYSNGARLPRVTGYNRGFARLSTNYYASARWINRRPGSGYRRGPGVGGRSILSLGSQGTAVTQVQRILGISPTGYYGTTTERAVRSFQERNGIYPVDGRVGSRTRRALQQYASIGYPSGVNNDYDYTYNNRNRYDNDYTYNNRNRYDNDYTYNNRDRYDNDYTYNNRDRYNNDYTYNNRDRYNNDYSYDYRNGSNSGGRAISRGSRGAAVRQVQRALGNVPVTGYYGTVTERAVRDFQSAYRLPVTGVVDSNTRVLLGV